MNGFQYSREVRQRAIHVLPEAGGWLRVKDQLNDELVPYLEKYRYAMVVLLVDFDKRLERREEVLKDLPESLQDRVFVLGTLSEPERLRSQLNHKGFEQIGQMLYEDCFNGTTKTWGHPLLSHNQVELDRLNPHIRPIIF